MAVSPKSADARERLAAALRENLKRRKARARALAEGQPARDEDTAAPKPSGYPESASKQD